MNTKQQKGFLITAGVLGALVAAELAGLFMLASASSSARDELDSMRADREALLAGKISPSRDNVGKIGEANQAMAAFRDKLVEAMKARQAPAASVANPSDFNLLLERERNELVKLAADTKVAAPALEGEEVTPAPVTLGEKFWLDFNDYGVAGKTPELREVPRLSAQLASVKAVVGAVIRAGASEIVSVTREKIEAPGTPLPGQEPHAAKPAAPEAGCVLTNFTCSVTFLAREAAVWTALQGLVNLPLPSTIVDVELRNKSQTLQPNFSTPGTDGGGSVLARLAAASASAGTGTRGAQETAGTELVQVTVKLRIHRVECASSETAAKPKDS